MKNCIALTDEGRLQVEDYRSIHKAILKSLLDGPKQMFDLMNEIRKNNIELKHLQIKIVVRAIDELRRQKLLVVDYDYDYVEVR